MVSYNLKFKGKNIILLHQPQPKIQQYFVRTMAVCYRSHRLAESVQLNMAVFYRILPQTSDQYLWSNRKVLLSVCLSECEHWRLKWGRVMKGSEMREEQWCPAESVRLCDYACHLKSDNLISSCWIGCLSGAALLTTHNTCGSCHILTTDRSPWKQHETQALIRQSPLLVATCPVTRSRIRGSGLPLHKKIKYSHLETYKTEYCL